MHAVIVVVHIGFAVLALVSGPLAVRFPNGTPRHRRFGRLYLTGWVLFAGTGFYLGALKPGISVFEVLNAVGAAFVLAGLWAIRSRDRLGPRWKRRHYQRMLTSYAFVAVATANQLWLRAGLDFSFWVFTAMVLAPFLILPPVIRGLDRRFAPRDPAPTEPIEATLPQG